MSGLLLGIVLSVCTCWFHYMVTLPSWLVSTDFGTCSYQCFLSKCTLVSIHMLLLLLLLLFVVEGERKLGAWFRIYIFRVKLTSKTGVTNISPPPPPPAAFIEPSFAVNINYYICVKQPFECGLACHKITKLKSPKCILRCWYRVRCVAMHSRRKWSVNIGQVEVPILYHGIGNWEKVLSH